MSQNTLATQAWTTAQLATLGRDLGSGTAPPTLAPDGSALRRGDVYYHTGLVCLLGWDGVLWRQRERAEVANAAARTAISTNFAGALYPGFQVLQTDLVRTYEWTGTFWCPILGVPGIRLLKATTQPVTAGVWTLVTWDTPAPIPAQMSGMFAAGNPSRLVAPDRGRYRAACVQVGVTNVQARYNSGGSSSGGTMLAGVNGLAAGSAVFLGADEVVMNPGDYVEFFVYQSTATNVGSQSGYTSYSALSYIGSAY